MSVLSLITGASIPVQLVMAMLMLASMFSWYYIFLKAFTLRRTAQQTAEFERQFWSGADLNELYQRAVNARAARPSTPSACNTSRPISAAERKVSRRITCTPQSISR